jgi:lysophospholipase L1-like esterase
MGKTSYQAQVNAHVIETNAWLRELARREGLLLIDLQPQLSDASGMRRTEFASEDGSHIPAAGYAAIAAYAEPLLEAHFRRAAAR